MGHLCLDLFGIVVVEFHGDCRPQVWQHTDRALVGSKLLHLQFCHLKDLSPLEEGQAKVHRHHNYLYRRPRILGPLNQ
jgi:hypothetical protein